MRKIPPKSWLLWSLAQAAGRSSAFGGAAPMEARAAFRVGQSIHNLVELQDFLGKWAKMNTRRRIKLIFNAVAYLERYAVLDANR